MAAFIPVPGVAQAVITWHVGGHKANNVLHWNIGSSTAWVNTNLVFLCNDISNGLKTTMQALMPSGTVLTSVAAVDLSTNTPQSGISTVAAWAGSIAGATNPSACLMLNLAIPYRYRGGHPRCYFPGPSAASLTANGDSWSTTAQNAWVGGWNAMVSSVEAAISGVVPCVPVYNYETDITTSPPSVTRKKISLKNVYPITSVTASGPVRTQRRRITAAA